jgi:hypothetical protein
VEFIYKLLGGSLELSSSCFVVEIRVKYGSHSYVSMSIKSLLFICSIMVQKSTLLLLYGIYYCMSPCQ